MTRIQYCHDRNYYTLTQTEPFFYTEKFYDPKGGRTIAVEVPTVEEFSVLSPSLKMPVPVKIGIAVCSKKDLYCKSTGRQFALSRLKDVNFYVTSELVPSVPGEPHILRLFNSELNITIQLTKYPNTNRVYFEGVV